jgi:hypothetical protein
MWLLSHPGRVLYKGLEAEMTSLQPLAQRFTQRHLSAEALEARAVGFRTWTVWFCFVDLDKLEMQSWARWVELQRAESRPGQPVHTALAKHSTVTRATCLRPMRQPCCRQLPLPRPCTQSPQQQEAHPRQILIKCTLIVTDGGCLAAPAWPGSSLTFQH